MAEDVSGPVIFSPTRHLNIDDFVAVPKVCRPCRRDTNWVADFRDDAMAEKQQKEDEKQMEGGDHRSVSEIALASYEIRCYAASMRIKYVWPR